MSQCEKAVKLWKSWSMNTVSDLVKHLDSFRILFAYNSGKNENDEIIIYDEDKQDYYHALNEYDEDESIDALAAFLEWQISKTWNRALKMAEGQKQKKRGPSAITENHHSSRLDYKLLLISG